MNYFSNRKKWMAYLILLTFVFTCIVPTNLAGGNSVAWAATDAEKTEQQTEQIEAVGGSVANATDGVTISKTIAPTGIENYFDITLQVQTKESIETLMETQTTDVVIVLDVSNTMNDLMENGKTRAYNAKEAAKQFAQDFYNALGSSGRIGIVAFNRDARVEQELIVPSSTSNIANVIDNIAISQNDHYYTKWTNIEAGLKAASAQLASPNSTAKHKYIVLLTDGFPTTYIQSGLTGYSPLDTTIDVTREATLQADGTYPDGVFYDRRKNLYCWQGNNYSDKAAAKAQMMAESITNSNINIFSIGIAIQNRSIKEEAEKTGNYLGKDYSLVDCYTPEGGQYVIGDDSPVAYKNWLGNVIAGGPDLGEGKTRYSDGDNLEALQTAYSGILQQIEETNRQAVEDSWIAADPMGKDVEFLHFYDKSGNVASALTNTGYGTVSKTDDENQASYSNAINWNLLQSKCTSVTSGTNPATTTYTYELKYCVRLENETADFLENEIHNTNGTTTLNYKVNNDGTLSSNKTLTFAIPQVKGYLGELSFTKVDSLTNEPLAGAEFTLRHADNCSVCTAANKFVTITDMTATSGEDGLVSFANIPSGHDYTLQETGVPKNYNSENLPTYNVTVAYDIVTDNIPDVDGQNVITNDRIGTVSVEGTKTWVDGSNEDNTRPDSITLNLYRYAVNDENQKVVNDEPVTATPEWSQNSDVWTYKFSGLEQYVKTADGKQYEYTYYVEEEPVDGYISETNGNNFTNTLAQDTVNVEGEKIWGDSETNNHENESVKLELFRDGHYYKTTETSLKMDWQYSFENLPKYALVSAGLEADEKADGHVFEYQVREQEIPAGYIPAYDVKVDANGNYTINITNNVRDDKETPLTISGEKIWKDGAEDHNAVEIQLFRNAETEAWKITTTALDWTYSFTDLPKYDDEGNWITYTVKEVPVDGYISTVIPTENGFDIVNTPYVENQGQIAVKKVVSGENTPPEGTEFDFNLKIKAELDLREFDAVVAKEAKVLEDAHIKAVEKQTAANKKLTDAETAFGTSAFMTTASSYQFILVDDSRTGSFAAVTSPSAMVYNVAGECAGVENEEADKTVLNSVLGVIAKLADSFSSLYNQPSFLHQLAAAPVQTTSPSALAFGITETDNLLKAYAEKRAADKLEADTLAAWQDYKVTTPTAIKVFWKDKDNESVVEFDTDDLKDGWYWLNFKLFNDETNSFEVKATTGSMITFVINESRPTQENYDTTDIFVVEGNSEPDKLSGVLTAGEHLLTTASAFGFTFENKYEEEGGTTGGGDPTYVSRTVEKVWNDNNNPDRPTSITVNLLRNGEVYETVTLSAANGWDYNWPNLDAGYTWSVQEVNVAEGYEPGIVRSGDTFVITNTYIPDETITDPDVPKGTVEVPGEPLDEFGDPEIPLGDAPATGDSANAVPFMALLLAAIIGLAITRRKFN